MTKTTIKTLLHRTISAYLRKRGYSDYAVSIVAERIAENLVYCNQIPFRKKLWALRHGFFCDKLSLYNLSEENYQDYLSDLDFHWLHPLNGVFSHWIDDKLTINYLLAPFSEFLPEYYYHVSTSGVTKLQDCPAQFSTDALGIINLLRKKGILAIKPIIGASGLGFTKLAYIEPNLYLDDHLVAEKEIFNLLVKWRCSDSGYIITEYLRPHPELSRIWSKTANSLRITVLRGSDNMAKVAYAFTRFGNTTSGVVENSFAGGIFNFINIQTGEFNQGKVLRNNRFDDCSIHPDSGEVINGIVPYWDLIIPKLTEISDFFPQLRYLGFDVVVVETGFKIIEINSHPSHEFFQWFIPAYRSEIIGPFFKEMLENKRDRLNKNRKSHAITLLPRNIIKSNKNITRWLNALNNKTHRRLIDERLELINNSGLFNAQWYIENYPDVGDSGMEPAHHYLLIGAYNGRDPGPDFSSSFYLDTYDDVKNDGINPLLHYLKYGKAEGRSISKH